MAGGTHTGGFMPLGEALTVTCGTPSPHLTGKQLRSGGAGSAGPVCYGPEIRSLHGAAPLLGSL